MNAKNKFRGANFVYSIGNSSVFDERARGGNDWEVRKNEVEREPNESMEISFREFTAFSQKLKKYYKTTAIIIFLRGKKDPELVHFATEPQPESNLSPKA